MNLMNLAVCLSSILIPTMRLSSSHRQRLSLQSTFEKSVDKLQLTVHAGGDYIITRRKSAFWLTVLLCKSVLCRCSNSWSRCKRWGNTRLKGLCNCWCNWSLCFLCVSCTVCTSVHVAAALEFSWAMLILFISSHRLPRCPTLHFFVSECNKKKFR